MSNIETAEAIAEKIRLEPYHLFRNDCISKSIKLKKECRKLNIPVKLVICIGLSRAKWFGKWLTIPVIHGWGEVEGKRIETSRPLGASGVWEIIPMKIMPLISIYI